MRASPIDSHSTLENSIRTFTQPQCVSGQSFQIALDTRISGTRRRVEKFRREAGLCVAVFAHVISLENIFVNAESDVFAHVF